MTQNNYWLDAEDNLEKKIKRSTKKYCTPSKLQNEIKKNDCYLKVLKNASFEDMDKNIQFYSLFRGIRKTFVSVRVRQVDILSENYEAVSSLRFN